jgi:hypothetical protein
MRDTTTQHFVLLTRAKMIMAHLFVAFGALAFVYRTHTLQNKNGFIIFLEYSRLLEVYRD